MRILYVITDLEIGGAPLHLLRLARRVGEAGHEPVVVSLRPPGPVAEQMRAAGVAVRSCGARGPWDWGVFAALAGHLRAVQPDIVHALLFHANLAARVAGLIRGFPRDRLLCEIHTVEVERAWHLQVDRFMHRFCRFTIGNSPSVVDHLHRAAGIPRERLRLVLPGVDVAAIAAAEPLDRAGLGVGRGEALLLWVGRLDPVKGLDTLVEAFGQLVGAAEAGPVAGGGGGRPDRGPRLLLAGEGPYRATLAAAIGRLGLSARVTLLGRRDDIPRLLRTADVFAFPSRTEGMPYALLEAMAAGLPVVATDVAGCHDLVTDGVTGLLVPPDDPAALARALRGVLADRTTAATLGDRACHLIGAEFTMERSHERYLGLYDAVVAGGDLA